MVSEDGRFSERSQRGFTVGGPRVPGTGVGPEHSWSGGASSARPSVTLQPHQVHFIVRLLGFAAETSSKMRLQLPGTRMRHPRDVAACRKPDSWMLT